MTLSFCAFPGICYNPSKPGIQIVQVFILLSCLKFMEMFLRGSLCRDLIAETTMKSLIRGEKNVANAAQGQHDNYFKKYFYCYQNEWKITFKRLFLVFDVHLLNFKAELFLMELSL